ncbi:MAG: ankyrin repeat domain-containing protein [Candidatus Dependentiae bacterium]|nr:ankyrin repeat domain-containing protein [Candidatus Dependentiae bacterium]
MKKLLLILCILSNSMQIFCSHEESTSQELDFEALKPKIILAINEGIGLGEIIKIKDRNPDLFSQFINHHRQEHSTFLRNAIYSNDPVKVKRLINLGADVNQENEIGEILLHLAARFNAFKAIPLLIDAGADVNKQDIGGYTPLHRAAQNEAIEAIQRLILANANINQETTFWHYTPLHLARYNNDDEAARLLIAAGANKIKMLHSF